MSKGYQITGRKGSAALRQSLWDGVANPNGMAEPFLAKEGVRLRRIADGGVV